MMRPSFIYCIALATVTLSPAHGMFMLYETEQVPIVRLFANLQARLANNTNDFETTYDLARLHSMAYATKLQDIAVEIKTQRPQYTHPAFDSGVPLSVQAATNLPARQIALRHLTNAILLYERSILLLKKSTNLDEQRWLILPTQLGLAWCLDQAGQRDRALKAYRKAYKIAWKIEVTGDFEIKQWLKDAWDDVRAGRNPVRTHIRGSIGPGVCFTREISGYLLKLLDPIKDAQEIAELNKDQQTLLTMGRSITPILVALVPGAELNELVDADAHVQFDLDGSGQPRTWGWITPKAAWLVFDGDGSGKISSGLQMFGNVTFWIFWRHGYNALAALDEDGDGFLQGAELRGLSLWHDINCNGIAEPGEVLPVEAWGIRVLNCSSSPHPTGIQWSACGATLTNGLSLPTFDWIAPSSTGQTALRQGILPGVHEPLSAGCSKLDPRLPAENR